MKKTELFERLREVLCKRNYTMPNKSPYKGTGAPGIYLENLLNLKAGNEDIPDAGSWEVKFYSPRTALITLFHKTPEPRSIMRDMLNQWGKKDSNGRRSFRHTIRGKSDRFRVVDDAGQVLVRPLKGKGQAPAWTHDTLMNIAGSKLRRLLLVQGKRSGQKVEYWRADCYETIQMSELINEIVRGTISIDFDLRSTDTSAIRDHGTKFRVSPDDVCRLYNEKKRFV